MAESKAEAIRAILADPGAVVPEGAGEGDPLLWQATAVYAGLHLRGYLIVNGDELPVTRWNDDKKHRCPWCHSVAVDMERPSRWRVYECCRCHARFARFPWLARWLPFAGVRCSEHRAAWLAGKENRLCRASWLCRSLNPRSAPASRPSPAAPGG